MGRPYEHPLGPPTLRLCEWVEADVRVYRDSGGVWAALFQAATRWRYPDVDLTGGLVVIRPNGWDEAGEFHKRTEYTLPVPRDWHVAVDAWKEGFRVIAIDPRGR